MAGIHFTDNMIAAIRYIKVTRAVERQPSGLVQLCARCRTVVSGVARAGYVVSGDSGNVSRGIQHPDNVIGILGDVQISS